MTRQAVDVPDSFEVMMQPSSYAGLHNHGEFSLLDGFARYSAYAKRAAELGMPALAITEHGNVHGWLDFWDACTAEGVKPILGIEAYQARKTRHDRDPEELARKAKTELEQRGPYHLTLLARNETGYRNLMRLSSRSFIEGFYDKPRLDRELLAEHAEGLIILTGCLGGEVCQALMRGDERHALEAAAFFRDAAGPENVGIEIMDHGIPEEKQVQAGLVDISRRLGLRLIPTGDCHYVSCGDAEAHDRMLCVSTRATVDSEDRFRFQGSSFYLHSVDEMAALFPAEWLANTLAVAEQVDFELRPNETRFPEFELPPGETDVGPFFERQVWSGLQRRFGDPLPDRVRERAEYELRVIAKMGFAPYFLIVADLVSWARRNAIPVGPGRGSAAASLCSYALQITRLDPLRFDLPFERFLVEGRKSPPDIDLDFDDRQRDRVIDYARSRYGEERVAHICTFSRIGARQAIRDAARVLGFDFVTSDRLNKLLPPPMYGVSRSIDDSFNLSPEFAKAYEQDADTRQIVDTARGLEGLVRQTGVHASGVVISPEPLVDCVPVMRRSNGPVIAQWDMEGVERSGLLKVDFLGLRNVTVIDQCIALVAERRGLTIDVDQLPLDDEATFRMLCQGDSQGVFQLEGGGMRELMVSLQPDKIEDLMALVALYRPGPLGSNVHKTFTARKHGRQAVVCDHPRIGELLAGTYGLILYQEDILKLARELAGFSVPDADDLRKAVAKKKMAQIGQFREAFVAGCAERSGVDPKVANKVYSDIEHFGAYGFPKPHAAAYALVAYWTAYLKANYPVEYMAALLASVDRNRTRTAAYLHECRRLGIRVDPPDINQSGKGFKVISDDAILFGLSSIDGLGPAVIDPLVASRGEPYRGLHDFLRRCPPQLLDKGPFERLAASGALDHLVPERPDRLLSRTRQMEVLEAERKLLTTYVTGHPLTGAWPVIAPQVETTIDTLETLPTGKRLKLGGVILECSRRTTKRGDPMCTFSLEDLSGTVEVVVFPRDMRRFGEQIVEGTVVLVEGKLSREGDEDHPLVRLLAAELQVPELPDALEDAPLRLRCQDPPSESILYRLMEVMSAHPGTQPVELEIPQGHLRLICRLPVTTGASADVLETALA